MSYIEHSRRSETVETTITCSLLLCYVFLIVIAMSSFSKYLHETVLKKRYAWITICEARCCILQILFRIPMEIGDALYFVSSENNISYLYIRQIFNLCHAISLQFLYYLLLSRFWLLYYDLGLVQSLLHNEWKYSIAPTATFSPSSFEQKNVYKNEWYKSNKNTYGNFKWIFKNRIAYIIIITFLIGPLPFCLSPLIFGLHSIESRITLILDTFMDFGFAAMLFIIRYNIPKINDNFFISKELKLIIYLMIFLSFLGFVLVANNFLFTDESHTSFIITSIVRNLWYFDESCLMFVSMPWVLLKVKPILTKYQLKSKYGVQYLTKRAINDGSAKWSECTSLQSVLITNETKSIHETIISKDDGNNDNIQLQLIQVLRNKKEFATFMEYYSLDLSMKNLLAFIECIQYEQLIHDYIQYYNYNIQQKQLQQNELNQNEQNVNERDEEKNEIESESKIFLNADCYIYQIINFCESIPKSTIVFQKGEDKIIYFKMKRNVFLDFAKECAYLLFDKYINYGSYEVDICQENQREIAGKMDNKHEWLNEETSFQDLISLFEAVCKEIFNSMTLSFYRFQKQKKEYNI